MSKFYKALEQAQRDRALAGQGRGPAPVAPVPPPASTPAAAVPPAAKPAGSVGPAGAFRRPIVPREPVDIPEGVDDHLVSLVTPAAFEAEQYRALRHIVEQRHRADNLSLLAVSSAAVGDGKTLTAANLAGALAQASDARVLLIEADLRLPSLARLLGFGTARRPGLVDAIVDENLTLADVALTRTPFNLNVVLAGQTLPSPYEVLKSPRLGGLLEEARSQYDYVILDTPPLVTVQDCRIIARWVDGVILVVGAHETPRRLVQESLNVLDPAKVLGFVFNLDDQGLARFYSSGPSAYHPRRPAKPVRTAWGRAIGKVASPFTRPDRARRPSQAADEDVE
jgi:capsular exopolysaccharide synthesis family protein